MELSQEFWKRNPLLLIGEPMERLPEFHTDQRHVHSVGELFQCFSKSELSRFILALHFSSEESAHQACDELLQHGAIPEQIVFLRSSPILRSTPIQGSEKKNIIYFSAHDSTEDIRLRISVQIELLRQSWLEEEIRIALPFASLNKQAALDRTHYAHALASALLLAPLKHKHCLRFAFFFSATHVQEIPAFQKHFSEIAALFHEKSDLASRGNSAWTLETPLEYIIAECADLAVMHSQNGERFRELFRERSVGLSFRLRSELRDAIERCFAPFLQGSRRVA